MRTLIDDDLEKNECKNFIFGKGRKGGITEFQHEFSWKLNEGLCSNFVKYLSTERKKIFLQLQK